MRSLPKKAQDRSFSLDRRQRLDRSGTVAVHVSGDHWCKGSTGAETAEPVDTNEIEEVVPTL
jgi:hypothetical protein